MIWREHVFEGGAVRSSVLNYLYRWLFVFLHSCTFFVRPCVPAAPEHQFFISASRAESHRLELVMHSFRILIDIPDGPFSFFFQQIVGLFRGTRACQRAPLNLVQRSAIPCYFKYKLRVGHLMSCRQGPRKGAVQPSQWVPACFDAPMRDQRPFHPDCPQCTRISFLWQSTEQASEQRVFKISNCPSTLKDKAQEAFDLTSVTVSIRGVRANAFETRTGAAAP